LTSIIEEKVSNLKSKFCELSGLRKKFEETKGETSPNLMQTRPRIRSIDSKEQNKPIFSGVIFRTEEQSCKEVEIKEFEYRPAHKTSFNMFPERELFEKSSKFEVEDLRVRLKNKEKELMEVQRSFNLQQAILSQKDKEVKVIEEKYKVLIEINKSLKIQINRLEDQMKNLDEKKVTNVNAIKNLSYIILSKDSPTKENKSENKNDQGFILKYIETLNELQSSDQLTLTVFEKLKNNQTREAFRLLMDNENSLEKRLKRTKEYVEQLEESVCECRSPTLNKTESFRMEKEIGVNDFYCFMKCQASLLEELLVVS
jgi:hypothetical protein